MVWAIKLLKMKAKLLKINMKLPIFACNMRYLSRLFKLLFTIYGFLVFTAFLLLIFPLVIIASFFGKINGGNFIYTLCTAWADFFLFMTGVSTKYIIEQPVDPEKQYVFVFNHISYIDIPFILKAVRKRHFRILGKAEMAKIPIFGFLYRNAVVLVDRSNNAQRAKSVRQLKSIVQKGISIIVSPEGTFNMTHKPLKDFYNGAFKVAIETQTPVKPLLFLDAYDRMPYETLFSLWPGKNRIVYLEEIPVAGLTIKDTAILKEKVYKAME